MAKGKKKKKENKAKLGVASVICCVNITAACSPCIFCQCLPYIQIATNHAWIGLFSAADTEMKTYSKKAEPPKDDPKSLDELIELAQKGPIEAPATQKCERWSLSFISLCV